MDRRGPWAALLVLCLGFFVIMLDATIVNVAIPTMLVSLHASLDQILWVVNAYLLALAVLLITAGRLGDMVGQRRLFAVGLGIFVLASALCGAALDPTQLIAFRVMQGVGAAIMSPQTLVIISAIFPAERRGAALGVLTSVTGLAAIAGPTIGGLLVTYLSWRWIFYVNVPIGLAGIVLAHRYVPDVRPGRLHRLDLVGVGLASIGLLGIVFGLIEGQRYDWGAIAGTSITIPELIASGVAVLGLLLLWERSQSEPLLPLGLLRNRNYWIATSLSALSFFALFGFILTLTIYFQSVLGWSAIHAGLTTGPLAVLMAAVAPFAGRLTDRVGGRPALIAGSALFATGLLLTAAVSSLDATSLTFSLPLSIAGVGIGCLAAPIMTVAMRTIPPALAGAAAGVLNTSRQVGGAMGAAVVGAVLTSRLIAGMHDRAVTAAGQVPAHLRAPFVATFASSARGGLSVGPAQSTVHLPATVPHEFVPRLLQLVHDVFANSYVMAMRPAIAVAAGGVLLGALACAFITRRTVSAAGPVVHAPSEQLASEPA